MIEEKYYFNSDDECQDLKDVDKEDIEVISEKAILVLF